MSSFWIDVLGHIGYVFITIGILLLTRKNIWGWLFRWMGEFIWLIIGILLDMSSIWSWGLIFLGLDIYGFYSWKKIEKLKE